MATGKPDSRETHVTRIFGTNKKGERLDDIWVDVERMDIVKSAMQVPPHLQWQGVQRKFRWADDPNADDYSPDGPPSRIVEIVKVCDPENTGNIDDPDEWVGVPVIRALRARAETGTEDNGGSAMERFLRSATAGELQTARVVEVRKIAHCDTNVDDAIQAAADANSTLRQYVVPSDVYVKDEATKDKDQYVDHEIITYLKHKGNAGDVAGIARQTKLLNEYLIDASDLAEGKVTGPFGLNPPYRLDPYQNIVNVNFGRSVIVVFVDLNPDRAASIFKVVGEKSGVELLRSFTIHTVNPDLVDAICSAYKVRTGAGTFMDITGATTDTFDGGEFYCLVFAIDGGVDESLDRAVSGTQFAMAAASSYFVEDRPTDVPSNLRTEGLIWFVGLAFLPPGKTIHWKIRYGNHRTDDQTSPPNKMVQCYPVTTPWTTNSSTFSKYTLICYRLDRKGSGPVYGAGNPDFNPPSFDGANALSATVDPPPLFPDNILP